MYYIIRWYNDIFLVYDASTQLLASISASTVVKAIHAFNKVSWDTSSQPGRFIFTEDAVLEYNIDTGKFKREHPIVYKLHSVELSYLQQHYPELLI